MPIASRIWQNVARFTVWGLGIEKSPRWTHQPADLADRARTSLGSAEAYLEKEPTFPEWLNELAPTRAACNCYVRSLFPSAFWIRRYNAQWLLGDFIAGITIGLVVVPQAMAYALLAGLAPEYGLYTSFTGASLYWLFGTSRDIVIGATAVGSLLAGQVVNRLGTESGGKIKVDEVAHTLSFLCGCVMIFFGVLRLGWIVELIPYITISAFITAASITIMSTQIPTALGIPGIDNHLPPFRVLVDTFRSLSCIKMDAFIGISSLVMLWIIRGYCSYMEARQPARRRVWSLVSSLRFVFIISLWILTSFVVNGPHPESPLPDSALFKPRFAIVGRIPKGFKAAKILTPNLHIVKEILPDLPAIVMVLVIEHIAIAKAMGRLYNYKIIASQEIVALGAANLLSPFVGGYVCTGSFGASAVMSKAGVRTPLAGVFSAMMLVLALYALTGVFYYIPRAALAGLIMHSVCNLLTPPKALYNYWQLSPLELLIWISCVAMGVLKSLDYAIYLGVGLSIFMLLAGIAKAPGGFVGVARARKVPGQYAEAKEVFLPFHQHGSYNPAMLVETPYPGVFVYRARQGYNYINQALHMEKIQSHLTQNTRRTSDEEYQDESDRLWNDGGTGDKHTRQHLPRLRALVADFSGVNRIDLTAIQGLMDLRASLDEHAAPGAVEWHFAHVDNAWTRRTLAAAGFGFPSRQNAEELARWKPRYLIAPAKREAPSDEDKWASVSAVDRPFFHVDLHEAVDAAVRNAQQKEGEGERVQG